MELFKRKNCYRNDLTDIFPFLHLSTFKFKGIIILSVQQGKMGTCAIHHEERKQKNRKKSGNFWTDPNKGKERNDLI